MRYRDLFEAPSELSYEDQIKPWAYKYAKEAGIHPRFALGLFDHESKASFDYQGVGDRGWVETHYPEDEWESQLSYGPGHFSIRALPDVKRLLKLEKYKDDTQIKNADWTTLRDNPEAAARFAILHLANLAKNNDGDFHTAYKYYRGNPNKSDANEKADQFISHVQKNDAKIIAITGEKPWDNPNASLLKTISKNVSQGRDWIQQNVLGMSQKEIADAKKEQKKNQQKADRLLGKQYTLKDLDKEAEEIKKTVKKVYNTAKGAWEYVTSPEVVGAVKKNVQDVADTITNPLDIKPDSSYGQHTSQKGSDGSDGGVDSTGYMHTINKSLDKAADWARGKLKKESMKTFKEYLNEIEFSPNTKKPTQYASGTIQSQGSQGSKRPTVAGNKAKMTDIDAGKGQPDQYMTTITKINPSTGEEEVIDQSNPHSSATAMRIKNAQSVANRTGARQRIMKA